MAFWRLAFIGNPSFIKCLLLYSPSAVLLLCSIAPLLPSSLLCRKIWQSVTPTLVSPASPRAQDTWPRSSSSSRGPCPGRSRGCWAGPGGRGAASRLSPRPSSSVTQQPPDSWLLQPLVHCAVTDNEWFWHSVLSAVCCRLTGTGRSRWQPQPSSVSQYRLYRPPGPDSSHRPRHCCELPPWI